MLDPTAQMNCRDTALSVKSHLYSTLSETGDNGAAPGKGSSAPGACATWFHMPFNVTELHNIVSTSIFLIILFPHTVCLHQYLDEDFAFLSFASPLLNACMTIPAANPAAPLTSGHETARHFPLQLLSALSSFHLSPMDKCHCSLQLPHYSHPSVSQDPFLNSHCPQYKSGHMDSCKKLARDSKLTALCSLHSKHPKIF